MVKVKPTKNLILGLFFLFICILVYLFNPISGGICNEDKVLMDAILSKPKKIYKQKQIDLKEATFNAYRKRIARYNYETLEQVMSLPSGAEDTYDDNDNNSEIKEVDVTIILNHFQRKSLCSQLDALLQQTVQPKHIWVCLFNSPDSNEYKNIILSYNNPKIKFIESEYNYKFYGRFQLALDAPTKYVWVVDDDMMAGSNYLEQLLHIIQIPQYRGMLGSIGWVLPHPRMNNYNIESYRIDGLYVPDPAYGLYAETMYPVDLLCSMWFFEQEWTKYLFREEQYTYETGEDFYFSYVLRKYGDIESFVLPVDVNNINTWGDLYHGFAAHNGATGDTGGKNVMIRDDLSWHIFQRGNRLLWSRDILKLPGLHRPLFIFVDGVNEASKLQSIVSLLKEDEYYLIISGNERGSCDEILLILNHASHSCSKHRIGIFNLGVSTADAYSLVFYGMKSLLLSYQPAAVISIKDDTNIIYHAMNDAINRINTDKSIEKIAFIPIPISSVSRFLFIATLPDLWYLRNWNQPKLVIHIVTFNNIRNLLSLLVSLNNVDYLGEKVNLYLHIDSDASLDISDMVSSFEWIHGTRYVHRRTKKVGYIANVIETWSPSSFDEYALFLEDDLVLSEFSYEWFKYTCMHYRYTKPEYILKRVYGISLTTQIINKQYASQVFNGNGYFHGKLNPLNKTKDKIMYTPYLNQEPSTWGSIFFPEAWIHFTKYLNTKSNEIQYNDIDIHSATIYKDTWRRYLTEMAYKNNMYMLYSNFKDQISFAIHRHNNDDDNKLDNLSQISLNIIEDDDDDDVVPLMEKNIILSQLPDHHLPLPEHLPILQLE